MCHLAHLYCNNTRPNPDYSGPYTFQSLSAIRLCLDCLGGLQGEQTTDTKGKGGF